MKFKSKAQMRWEVSKEMEQDFKHAILVKYPSNIIEGINIDELFKLIRGAEYRRGKEDGIKEFEDSESNADVKEKKNESPKN